MIPTLLTYKNVGNMGIYVDENIINIIYINFLTAKDGVG